jgi:hypothetical protein
VGTGTSGSSTTPDAPSVTASWGSDNNLFIAMWSLIFDGDFAPTLFPATYTNASTCVAFGTQADWMATMQLKLAAATSDPGTATSSSGGFWHGQTIVIRPAAAAVPDAPTNLTATPISASRIDLAWDDNASDETSQRVERSPNGSTGWVTVGTPAADAETFSNTGLSCGTTYFYRVFAVNGSGDSLPSNTASATTSACPPSTGGNRMGGTGAIRKPPRPVRN